MVILVSSLSPVCDYFVFSFFHAASFDEFQPLQVPHQVVSSTLANKVSSFVRANDVVSREIVVVVLVQFFNKTSSNAKQTTRIEADNTDTQNVHECKQSTVLSVKHQ